MGRLFWKFFLCILLAQAAAMAAIAGAFWLEDRARMLRAGSDIDTGPRAEMLVESAAATLEHGGSAALRALLGSMRRTMFAVDERGADVLGRPVPAPLRAQAELLMALDAPRGAVRRLSAADGHEYTLFIARDGRRKGTGRARRADGPLAPFARHVAPLACATLASFLFAALLAWYFSRPIRALRSAFDAAAAGDLTPRFGAAAGIRRDELSDLGRDFDRMSARLQLLMDGQRRLLHDVSHELRSPLARLQAAIGLAYQQPEKTAASLLRIERESERIDKLVGELLTLSRLEAAAPLQLDDEIDIMELVREVASDGRYEGGEGKLRISVSGSAGASLRGAADMLWRALDNVVRNAIKHGAAGGQVEIAVETGHGLVCIVVSDRGPGVPEEALGDIFEPFFRARAGLPRVEGHGLGLAIARRVVHAHDGSVEAANRPGGGLSVTITLPLRRC